MLPNRAEVASAALALFVWEGGLPMLGAASCVTTACAALVSWTAAAALPPEQAQGRIRLAPACGGAPSYSDLPEQSVEVDEQAAQSRGCREYLCGSADMMLRSGSLQVSIFAMALCAARLGPAPLAAHQITMSLCALTHSPFSSSSTDVLVVAQGP